MVIFIHTLMNQILALECILKFHIEINMYLSSPKNLVNTLVEKKYKLSTLMERNL